MQKEKKLILSALMVLLVSLLLPTIIYKQTASAFFHEKLFGGDVSKPGDKTKDKPKNIPTAPPKDEDVQGSAENDVLAGLGGNDMIDGKRGNDILDGSAGDDYLIGGQGNDILKGGPGNDVIEGNTGNDSIDSSAGDDYLFGGPGPNNLTGGVGNDTLIGGPNSDTLTGGAGQDTFVCNQGIDKVLDFNAAEGDIRLNDCEDTTTNITAKQLSNGNITGTTNITAGSNNNKTTITDETPELGETGDILSDLNLTP
jgi:Ca2+-binding RTX toxin-like protein